jgi:hypothetical protein
LVHLKRGSWQKWWGFSGRWGAIAHGFGICEPLKSQVCFMSLNGTVYTSFGDLRSHRDAKKWWDPMVISGAICPIGIWVTLILRTSMAHARS